jgi:hypothetical protein
MAPKGAREINLDVRDFICPRCLDYPRDRLRGVVSQVIKLYAVIIAGWNFKPLAKLL